MITKDLHLWYDAWAPSISIQSWTRLEYSVGNVVKKQVPKDSLNLEMTHTWPSKSQWQSPGFQSSSRKTVEGINCHEASFSHFRLDWTVGKDLKVWISRISVWKMMRHCLMLNRMKLWSSDHRVFSLHSSNYFKFSYFTLSFVLKAAYLLINEWKSQP